MVKTTAEQPATPPTIIVDAKGTHKIGPITCTEPEADQVQSQLKILQVAHPKTPLQKLLDRALSAVRKNNARAIKGFHFPEERGGS